MPNNWLSSSQRSPFTGEFFYKHSHTFSLFASIILEPCLMKYFGSISGCGLVLKQASKNLKIPVPRGGLAESGILKRAFWGLKPLWHFQRDNSFALCWSLYNDNTENRESTPKTHWGWHLPSDESIGGVHSSGYGDAPLPFANIIE